MQKKTEYDVTPLGMLNNAEVWYVLYRQNINLGTQHKIIATYCLLISLEMFLKAYLIYLNKETYSFDSKLLELGHKFENILNAIKKEKNPKLLEDIERLIKKYSLVAIDTNSLRYPRKGDKFLMHGEYLKPYNQFDELIDAINVEVSKSIEDKFYEN